MTAFFVFSIRLIVVAEKEVVYKKFPIPLINRLEKHILSMQTMLSPAQIEITEQLQTWAEHFTDVVDSSRESCLGPR